MRHVIHIKRLFEGASFGNIEQLTEIIRNIRGVEDVGYEYYDHSVGQMASVDIYYDDFEMVMIEWYYGDDGKVYLDTDKIEIDTWD